MSDVIGKVAALENDYRVLINRGSKDGVKDGMIFVIEDPRGKEVRDPDTDEFLTHLPVEKIRVRVFEVHDNYCRAETFVKVKPKSMYEIAAGELLHEYRMKRDFPGASSMGWPFQTPPEARANLDQALHFLRLGAAERDSDERPAVVEVNVGDIARQAS